MAVDGVCEGRQSVFAAMYVIGSISGETAGYGVIKFEDEGDSEANVMDLTGDIEGRWDLVQKGLLMSMVMMWEM